MRSDGPSSQQRPVVARADISRSHRSRTHNNRARLESHQSATGSALIKNRQEPVGILSNVASPHPWQVRTDSRIGVDALTSSVMLPSDAPRRSLFGSAPCPPSRGNPYGCAHVRSAYDGVCNGGCSHDTCRARMLSHDEESVRRYADVRLTIMLPEGTAHGGCDRPAVEGLRASWIDPDGCSVCCHGSLSAGSIHAWTITAAGHLFAGIPAGFHLHSSHLAPVSLRSPRARLFCAC